MITSTYIHTTHNHTPCQGIHGKTCEFILKERIVAVNNSNYSFKIESEKCSHNVHGCRHEGTYTLTRRVNNEPTPLLEGDCYTQST